MIGMQMGKSLEQVKDEVDVDVITRRIKASVAGEKLLMDDKQAQQIAEAFGQKMQAKQIAKMMADAKKNKEAGDKFLAENAKQPGVKTTPSGLQYQVITEGTGPSRRTPTSCACTTRARCSTARLRQLLRPRHAGHLPAGRRDSGLARGPRADAGGQ
jgi:FKBP-type peptidyl-prolyl cis-trans isomerase